MISTTTTTKRATTCILTTKRIKVSFMSSSLLSSSRKTYCVVSSNNNNNKQKNDHHRCCNNSSVYHHHHHHQQQQFNRKRRRKHNVTNNSNQLSFCWIQQQQFYCHFYSTTTTTPSFLSKDDSSFSSIVRKDDEISFSSIVRKDDDDSHHHNDGTTSNHLVHWKNITLQYPQTTTTASKTPSTIPIVSVSSSTNQEKEKEKVVVEETTTQSSSSSSLPPSSLFTLHIPELKLFPLTTTSTSSSSRSSSSSSSSSKGGPNKKSGGSLPNTGGGHAIIGLNGSGKSLLSNAFVELSSTTTKKNKTNTTKVQQKPSSSSSPIPQPRSSSSSAAAATEALSYILQDDKKQMDLDHPNNHCTTSSSSTSSISLPVSVIRVSFESHEELLQVAREQEHEKKKLFTVYQAVTPRGGKLNQQTQYLVVRFGLYSLLSNSITTLSTGEIRKVLLLRSFLCKPTILLLDNALDGLDIPSRSILNDMINKICNGFQYHHDLLIADISSSRSLQQQGQYQEKQKQNQKHEVVPPVTTKVILITNRPEEIVDEITNVTFLPSLSSSSSFLSSSSKSNSNDVPSLEQQQQLRTEKRGNRTGLELIQTVMNHTTTHNEHTNYSSSTNSFRNDSIDRTNNNNSDTTDLLSSSSSISLPTIEEIRQVWYPITNKSTTISHGMNLDNNLNLSPPSPLFEIINLTVQKQQQQQHSSSPKNDSLTTTTTSTTTKLNNKYSNNTDNNNNNNDTHVTLLNNMNWTLYRGQRWLLAGGNGMGKSTLSRTLLLSSAYHEIRNQNKQHCDESKIRPPFVNSPFITNTTDTSTPLQISCGQIKWDSYSLDPIRTIGYVSTELHLQTLQEHRRHSSTTASSSSSSSSSSSKNNDNDGEPTVRTDIFIDTSNNNKTTTTFGLQSSWDFLLSDMIQPNQMSSTGSSSCSSIRNSHLITKRIETIASWFQVTTHQLQRPFLQLSQGEQKMMLIVKAFVTLPSLVILDEPLQGLDILNRQLVLNVLERICQGTDLSLIYVTHHFDELIPSISNVIHLRDGTNIYTGPLKLNTNNEYDPTSIMG